MTGDVSEKCENCRKIYAEFWQNKRDLLDTAIKLLEDVCERCEGEWGKCKDECTFVKEQKSVIAKNKGDFVGLY